MSKNKCDRCEKVCIGYGMVELGNNEGSKSETICNDCYNEDMANKYSVENYKDFITEILPKDCDGITRKFNITKMIFGTGILWEAVEFIDGYENIGYSFEVHQDLYEDSFESLQQLYKKINTGISKKFIKKGELNGEEHFSFNENYVEGKIDWDDKYNGCIPKLKIDGKDFSLEQLGNMMMTYEGWNFRLEIKEPTD